MKRKGFTLTELMITISVIGLLAAIAMPRFTKVSDSAKAAQVQGNLTSIRTAIQMFHAKSGEYPKGLIDERIPLDKIEAKGVKFTDFYSKSKRPFTPAFKSENGKTMKAKNDIKTSEIIKGKIMNFSGDGGWLAVMNDSKQEIDIYADLSTPIKNTEKKNGKKPFDPFGQGIDWTKF